MPKTSTAPSRREERRLVHQDLSRQQLLDSAEEVFGDKGFHETTLKEIAELAEFSVGSVYLFFESKDELFRQVFVRRGEQFIPALHGILDDQDADPVAQLHALVDFVVEFFRRHPRFGRLYFRYENATRHSAAREIDVVMRIQASLFERGQRAGSFHEGDPSVLARLFSGLMSAYQAFDSAFVSDDGGDMERLPLTNLHNLVARAFVVDS